MPPPSICPRPDAVKKTLLAATSVKNPTGAALLTVKVFADLQIGDKVKDNSATRSEVALTGKQYEINIYPLSREIIPRKDLDMGPVIKEAASAFDHRSHAGQPQQDAKALIKFLQGPAIDAPPR